MRNEANDFYFNSKKTSKQRIKEKASIRATVENILSLPEAEQIKTVRKVFDAVYRRQQRLYKMGEENLSYNTVYQLSMIKKFSKELSDKNFKFVNNAATLVKNDTPILFNKLYSAIRFMRDTTTTEAGAMKAFVESAEKYGRTPEQQSVYNKIWKYANDRGLLDIYDPSDFYSIVEEEDMDMPFEKLIERITAKVNNMLEKAGSKERINSKTGSPFIMPKADNVSFRKEPVPIDKHWHSVMPDDIPQFKISSIKKKKIK